MPNFIFFDINEAVVQAFSKHFHKLFPAIHSDLLELLNSHKIDMIVSPANMFGYYNGGIDAVYAKIFDNIGKNVQAQIREVHIYHGQQDVLPIGSAITVTTNHEKCPKLICAPTMFYPSPINETRNVYHAFYAVLKCTQFFPKLTIAVPGMGTGCGNIGPEECASEMRRAYDDFISDKPVYTKQQIVIDKPGMFVLNRSFHPKYSYDFPK